MRYYSFARSELLDRKYLQSIRSQSTEAHTVNATDFLRYTSSLTIKAEHLTADNIRSTVGDHSKQATVFFRTRNNRSKM